MRSIEGNIVNLEAQWVIFDDKKNQIIEMRKISFYKIKRYFINFKDEKTNKISLKWVKFSDILNCYYFDNELRKHLLFSLWNIEEAFKNVMIQFVWDKIFDEGTYFEKYLEKRIEFIENKKEELIKKDLEVKKYFKKNKNISCELFINKLTFWEINRFFQDFKLKNKQMVSQKFWLDFILFESWLESLIYLRNLSSHWENIFNRKMLVWFKWKKIIDLVWNNNRFKGFLIIIWIFEKILLHLNKEKSSILNIELFRVETFPFEHNLEALKVLVNTLYDFYVKKSNYFSKKNIILAFETSCDDTSIAIFEDEKLLFMDTASQIKIHNITWWVVPEVAAREHANAIFGVLEKVLHNVQKNNPSAFQAAPFNSKGSQKSLLEQIDYIWVTTNPGLLPSLLTGTTVASTISTVLQIPIIPINHIQAHVFSNFLERKEEEIKFPCVCLTVSGGHNDIYFMKNMWDLEKVGSTTDDSSGEAFDKVAKMMWLEYPGGPIISKLSEVYKRPVSKETGLKPLFPRVWLVKKEADFSFSGLKSAVKREVDKRTNRGEKELTTEDKIEISFEFQEAVIEVLAYKLVQVALQNWVKNVMLAWGVSANNRLKEEIIRLAKKHNLEFIFPVSNLYCMDNAAMVWILTHYKIKYWEFEKKIWVVKL